MAVNILEMVGFFLFKGIKMKKLSKC